MDHLHQTREEDTQDCYVHYAMLGVKMRLCITAVSKFFQSCFSILLPDRVVRKEAQYK